MKIDNPIESSSRICSLTSLTRLSTLHTCTARLCASPFLWERSAITKNARLLTLALKSVPIVAPMTKCAVDAIVTIPTKISTHSLTRSAKMSNGRVLTRMRMKRMTKMRKRRPQRLRRTPTPFLAMGNADFKLAFSRMTRINCVWFRAVTRMTTIIASVNTFTKRTPRARTSLGASLCSRLPHS